MCCWNVEIEWESTKYRGKCPCGGFCPIFSVSLALACCILIIGGDELSKCSLKYEPTVFKINTNVKVGIIPILMIVMKMIVRKMIVRKMIARKMISAVQLREKHKLIFQLSVDD